jgi:hypothetical protein
MMKITCLTIAAASAFCVASAFGADAPGTFTGLVTDTMCGSKPHRDMMKDKTDAECVRLCARGQHEYALFDGTTVMKLSDQRTPAKYAGQRVRVTGVYDNRSRTLRVVSMEPTSGN